MLPKQNKKNIISGWLGGNGWSDFFLKCEESQWVSGAAFYICLIVRWWYQDGHLKALLAADQNDKTAKRIYSTSIIKAAETATSSQNYQYPTPCYVGAIYWDKKGSTGSVGKEL